MENFSFESYRNNLAKDLKATKSIDGKEVARKKLSDAKQDKNYKTAKSLHAVKKLFPPKIITSVTKNLEHNETEDDLTMWEVEDISDKIPQEYKFFLDAHALDVANSAINIPGDYDEEYKVGKKIREAIEVGDGFNSWEYIQHKEQFDNFIDSLLEGKYLDKKNLNHVIAGQGPVRDYNQKSFDRHSNIEASKGNEYGKDGFWMCNGYNIYAERGFPVVIFSPNNLAALEFFENEFYPPINLMLEHIKAGDGKVEWDDKGENNIARLYFLAGLPVPSPDKTLGYFFAFESKRKRKERASNGDNKRLMLDTKWSDIAESILDLRAGKVWKRKHTEEELKIVKEKQEFYKKWIEENLK